MATSDSEASDGPVDDFTDEFDNYDSEDGEESCDSHKMLVDDIRRLKEEYSDEVIQVRTFTDLADMELKIFIPTELMERSVAAAWSLKHGEPLVVNVWLDRHQYLDAEKFQKVDVFQLSTKSRGVAVTQLKNIAEIYCQNSLKKLKKDSVEYVMVQDKRKALKEHVESLIQMGFNAKAVRKALQITNGSREEAIDILLNGNILEESLFPCNSSIHVNGSDLLPKKALTLEKGFLVQLYQYMSQRLLTLNDFCPVCDKACDLQHLSMLKPVVCNNELCLFTFNLITDTADFIAYNPKVADLLVIMTKAAVLSPRYDQILTPYPTVINPLKQNEVAVDEKKKDIRLLREVIKYLPDVTVSQDQNGSPSDEEIDLHQSLCKPLLKWIIDSNRSFILALPSQEQMEFMGTRHQFLMKNLPPSQEMRFSELKKTYGSRFAFHGSPLENWHSIIREGLIVASGTRKQMHGAAYGKGIYLSPYLDMSLSYCTNLVSWEKFNPKASEEVLPDKICGSVDSLRRQILCVALCEVIDCKDFLQTISDRIWISKQSEYVCTRFLFVYDLYNPTGEARRNCVNTNDKRILDEIQETILKAYF